MRRWRSDERGFNLPETLAVLCLLAIMASIAIPLVAERARLAKIRTMVNQFAFDIRAARWTAVTARHTVDLAVDVDPGNAYEYTDVRGNLRRRIMPEGVRIVASTDPIQFEANGAVLGGSSTVIEVEVAEGLLSRWTISTNVLGVPSMTHEQVSL
jgi:prepilin-type N-terminal cleavage/methylation domain-containing protein